MQDNDNTSELDKVIINCEAEIKNYETSQTLAQQVIDDPAETETRKQMAVAHMKYIARNLVSMKIVLKSLKNALPKVA